MDIVRNQMLKDLIFLKPKSIEWFEKVTNLTDNQLVREHQKMFN